MAKATRHGGDSYTEDEFYDPDPPVRIHRAMLGEVDKPSVGGASIQFSENDPTTNEEGKPSPRQPARMTGNPSSQTDPESSGADSTGGSGRATRPRQSARKTAKKTAAKKSGGRARVRSTDEDF